eukprot:TRINITY_DN31696_c0_g1_i1.p1 TRINITY_DN31696_c0_g1~~TRINITY_DN31696_c0_g1_i1.p1  ORF type:complete len:264 (+),score=49.69 TRINITY_DN31696_c0_g1_i1:158-949(+)
MWDGSSGAKDCNGGVQDVWQPSGLRRTPSAVWPPQWPSCIGDSVGGTTWASAILKTPTQPACAAAIMRRFQHSSFFSAADASGEPLTLRHAVAASSEDVAGVWKNCSELGLTFADKSATNLGPALQNATSCVGSAASVVIGQELGSGAGVDAPHPGITLSGEEKIPVGDFHRWQLRALQDSLHAVGQSMFGKLQQSDGGEVSFDGREAGRLVRYYGHVLESAGSELQKQCCNIGDLTHTGASDVQELCHQASGEHAPGPCFVQ